MFPCLHIEITFASLYVKSEVLRKTYFLINLQMCADTVGAIRCCWQYDVQHTAPRQQHIKLRLKIYGKTEANLDAHRAQNLMPQCCKS